MIQPKGPTNLGHQMHTTRIQLLTTHIATVKLGYMKVDSRFRFWFTFQGLLWGGVVPMPLCIMPISSQLSSIWLVVRSLPKAPIQSALCSPRSSRLRAPAMKCITSLLMRVRAQATQRSVHTARAITNYSTSWCSAASNSTILLPILMKEMTSL